MIKKESAGRMGDWENIGQEVKEPIFDIEFILPLDAFLLLGHGPDEVNDPTF